MDDDKIRDLKITQIASAPRKYKKEGTPPVGLYFTNPPKIEGFEFPIQLGHAFRSVNQSIYEKNMHAMELDLTHLSQKDSDTNADIISEICKNSGVVFILRSQINAAEKYKADGVIFDDSDKVDINEVREKFGDDFIIGIDCKDDTEILNKYLKNEEIDYITLNDCGNIEEIVTLWKNNSDKPCVLKGYVTDKNVEEFVNYGFDFIECGDFAWSKKEKVAENVTKLIGSIDTALTNRNIQ